MRVLIQRVSEATVSIGNTNRSAIRQGLLVLLGIEAEDNDDDVQFICKKIANLRIFDDEYDIMNKSVLDIYGDILVVSQFTLYASTEKGNRPSYIRAAKSAYAMPLYEKFCQKLSETLGKSIETGEFGADMQVMLVNDGPVTIWIDSKNRE